MIESSKIIEQIERLRTLDRDLKVFGASSHRYQLNPCLTEDVVYALEKRYKILLPKGYRQFVLEVGNGGAGPAYGMFKLGEYDDGWGFCTWDEGDLLDDPSAPFLLRDKWNLPDEIWTERPKADEMGEDEYDRAIAVWIAKVDKLAWESSIMNGAIPICHLGCAYRQWLVVTGDEKGNIWCDDRASDGGVYPLISEEGRRVTFLEWYEGWLNKAITSFE